MRKLRTQRDNQQWMLDLALNMRGRVQNFERDDVEVLLRQARADEERPRRLHPRARRRPLGRVRLDAADQVGQAYF
jgi:hypothetical protein